ncbi:putative leucine-rich repeat-containing protein DDB_G0290503 isoform X2 [Topomyia yanbarensis]|uniref:putative leucine-rich repeat-containing protein DDB_G0290503 isoform X2 n=1 Tax=Topomyia yanbarensis TaxID=2498891 RepID=UPI00273ADAE7|nr:putative leucine-rich repeat-containing protein DDB_G0290503 isoform X2 [Topomyia yanbarensis]
MFNFFKRSKSQKSKQKHEQKLQQPKRDGNASQYAAPSACVASTLETQLPTVVQQHVREGSYDRNDAKVYLTGEFGGNGREGGSIKNKQHSPPSVASFSPSDIIHENGRSFGYENGIAIEFADEESDGDGNAINECVQRENSLPIQVRGEPNDSTFERSSSYNQNAVLFESDMAKGRNKRRYQQQQHQGSKNFNHQQGQSVNKDSHLLQKQTENSLDKFEKAGIGKVGTTTPTENEIQVQQSDDKVYQNDSKEEQKVTNVSSDADFQQRSVPMVDDVKGKNVEDREDKNRVVVLSVINKSSFAERPDQCDGVSIVSEGSTATAQSSTSPFSLTQTTVNGFPTGTECNELLSSINSSSVSQQYPQAELHSSATTNISDDQRNPLASGIVTTEDVTSNKEMGQQPSKTSDLTNRSRRSATPTHQPTLIVPSIQQQLSVHVKPDAFRDDTSDDRDVFYEATESVSPTSPPSSASLDGGVNKTLSPFLPSQNYDPGLSQKQSNPSELRITPKKRVVFSDQLIIEGNPLQENDSSNGFSDSTASTESLSDSLNLEREIYESTAKNNDEQMHAAFLPGSPVNNTNGVNVVLSVSNEQHAFNSDNSGILGSVPVLSTKRKLIDFKYDDSDPKDTKEKFDETTSQSKIVVIDGDSLPVPDNETSLVVEDVISLPDVVQPTSIEKAAKQPFNTVDKINSEMKELVNQESRYSAKLEDAEKRASDAQTKVYELQSRLDDVKRDVSLKECNVERLKAELEAACKECDGIQMRLRTQNAQMDALRLKYSEREDELNLRYQNLEVELLEVNEKLKDVRQLANELNSQLLEAKSEAQKLKEERDKLLEERAEEQKIIKEALEIALKERTQVEVKWKNDFERLRTVHSDREEHLMEDCEWKIRSMQKHCKEKLEGAERERKMAMDKAVRLEQETRKHSEEAKHLRTYEAEVAQLRGLTYDQKEALTAMSRQVDKLKAELEVANSKLEAEIVKVQQIKSRCEYQLCEKEREALNRIEIARGEIAMQWEDRLLHEMSRLKYELEQMHMEERLSAIAKLKKEALEETEALTHKFNVREKQLKNEIDSLKAKLKKQKQAMEDAQTEADAKLVQSRMFVERAEREHEAILEKEMSKRDQIIEDLKVQHEKEKEDMEQHFSLRIQQVQEEFARELSDTTELLKVNHKRELEKQWKQLVHEKEEALQLMESRQRTRMEEAENKISFEEMRMRYERREPRREDLQQIEELKSVIESQDHDLRLLTERLREMQLQEEKLLHQQQLLNPPQPPRRAKNRGKQLNSPNDLPLLEEQQQYQQEQLESQIHIQPVVTSVPIVCDVIYEENEADLIKEEEEDQQAAQQVLVVDVPESAIQTETTLIQSTEPMIIEILSPETVQRSPDEISSESITDQDSTAMLDQSEILVIESDQLPESQPEKPILIPTPIIVITADPTMESEEEEDLSMCTVVELPSQPVDELPPAEPVCLDMCELQQKLKQNMPEKIVPDVVAEAASHAVDDVLTEAIDAVVCAPGPRSSST